MPDTVFQEFTPAEASYFANGGEIPEETFGELSEGFKGGALNGQPEAKPAEEKKASDNPDDYTDEAKNKHVPFMVLNKERERRRAAENERSELREKFARSDERLALLNQILGKENDPPKAATQVEEIIDPEKDIFGAFRQLAKQNSELKDRLEGKVKSDETRLTEASFISSYQADAQRFTQAKPDFPNAYNHIMRSMKAELELGGITDSAQINKIIAQNEKMIAANAAKSGKSMAEAVYNWAVNRGYSAPSGAASVPNKDTGKNESTKQVSGNSGANADALEEARAKVEALAKGKGASASLSGSGGSGGADLTQEALANMSEEQFADVVSKLSRSQQRKLFGGDED